MDWRYNTIWWEQLPKKDHVDYHKAPPKIQNLEDKKYAIIWHYKHKGESFESMPKSDSLLYLELNWANIRDFNGINKFKNLKRLELHCCIKLESDRGVSALKNKIEHLHISSSKKFRPSKELLQLRNLKVLCLNSCGELDNLKFLKYFPKLVDFRFADTNVIDGDLSPIIKHPNLRSAGFMNKRHYNFTYNEIESRLNLKSSKQFKDWAYKGELATFKYKCYDE